MQIDDWIIFDKDGKTASNAMFVVDINDDGVTVCTVSKTYRTLWRFSFTDLDKYNLTIRVIRHATKEEIDEIRNMRIH